MEEKNESFDPFISDEFREFMRWCEPCRGFGKQAERFSFRGSHCPMPVCEWHLTHSCGFPSK